MSLSHISSPEIVGLIQPLKFLPFMVYPHIAIYPPVDCPRGHPPNEFSQFLAFWLSNNYDKHRKNVAPIKNSFLQCILNMYR